MVSIQRFRQFSYLLIVSALGLFMLHQTAVFVQRKGWIVPEDGPHILLVGLLTDIVIILPPTIFLILMAWLPRQLHGGVTVSFTLVLGILGFETLLLVGGVSTYLFGELQPSALWLALRLREFLIIGILPFILIELFRRKVKE